MIHSITLFICDSIPSYHQTNPTPYGLYYLFGVLQQWRAQQIATGEAKENANFQPLGGDW